LTVVIVIPASARPELSFRARKILYAVITEYIATGEPVGSRRLSRRYGLNLSPASIRNVLADLEDAGLLVAPHTSAGRVPTDAGFRIFVDALVQMREVSSEDKAAIVARMGELKGNPSEVMRETGRLLSAMTGAASVVVPPKAAEEPLAQLRFMSLRQRELLAVVVTRSGAVQNRVVRLERDLSNDELERIHNYLAGIVEGRNLREIRDVLASELLVDRNRYASLHEGATELVQQTLDSNDEPEVLIEGQGRLFDRPEFSSAEKIRAFLRTFEDRELVLDVLERTLESGGVHVLIGIEAGLADVSDVSVIGASYRHGQTGGSVGIIGPARIDYGKVVPLVEFTARTMGLALEDRDEDDSDGSA
jgi:heat-inducible transcriptional repressor